MDNQEKRENLKAVSFSSLIGYLMTTLNIVFVLQGKIDNYQTKAVVFLVFQIAIFVVIGFLVIRFPKLQDELGCLSRRKKWTIGIAGLAFLVMVSVLYFLESPVDFINWLAWGIWPIVLVVGSIIDL